MAVLYCFLNKEVGRGLGLARGQRQGGAQAAGPHAHLSVVLGDYAARGYQLSMPTDPGIPCPSRPEVGGSGGQRWALGLASPAGCPQVQAELLRSWHRRHLGEARWEEHQGSSSHPASARPTSGAATEKLLLSRGRASSGASQDPSAGTHAASSVPGLAESPF